MKWLCLMQFASVSVELPRLAKVVLVQCGLT